MAVRRTKAFSRAPAARPVHRQQRAVARPAAVAALQAVHPLSRQVRRVAVPLAQPVPRDQPAVQRAERREVRAVRMPAVVAARAAARPGKWVGKWAAQHLPQVRRVESQVARAVERIQPAAAVRAVAAKAVELPADPRVAAATQPTAVALPVPATPQPMGRMDRVIPAARRAELRAAVRTANPDQASPAAVPKAVDLPSPCPSASPVFPVSGFPRRAAASRAAGLRVMQVARVTAVEEALPLDRLTAPADPVAAARRAAGR